MKKALITGITGQDGSYLAELLLSKGYEVHGIVRRESLEDSRRRVNLVGFESSIHLHVGFIENHLSIYKIISQIKPDECYHLASSSFVSYSFDDEASLLTNNFTATHSLLASLRELVPECRVYFAGSSEMFGNAPSSPQSELTPFNPRSVYGISKLAAFHLASNYRTNHNLFIAGGILYNHESSRRGFQFVTRKITSTVAKIYHGLTDRIELGNVNALRDWGYAPDYVSAMHAMLQLDEPQDFVISTGQLHDVRHFLELAFQVVGLDYNKYLNISDAHFRPSETIPLCGNSAKAREFLNWKPTKSLDRIIEEMVLADLDLTGNSK
ncbi:GDP-mannose 4,6-dehydratase [Cyanobium sp. BA5m-21]|uniref:GDP-mannose 4,6-dehydratase n=1 Tax=unclassified Cyanobium TaxID=2627006 RepID=UPI0020CE6D2D|nr:MULTISPECIES: GDP-mannose 4,6-dehydratase [unclassified Cyanobium]MCP9903228.1 GDP-mannose 4,6-dehydratase [Cyanobium sp. BA5m-10]MCP9908029.1 GDP-mannose 4,6-dehydratase [Cyanobium sp. BA5m-21]